MIRHAFYLATRYLAAAPGRTLVLILGTAVALFLPAFTSVASGELRAALLSRAESSPVLPFVYTLM